MNPIEQRLASVLSRDWWLLLPRGLVAIVFGVLPWVQPVVCGALIAWQPGAGALALFWLIASYAVVFGVLLAILAFKMRRFAGITK